MKKFYVITVVCGIFVSFLMLSCSNIANGSRSLAKDEVVPQKIVIGDELVYGEHFSFQDVYAEIFDEIENVSRAARNARSASFEAEAFEIGDNDVIDMVYFSVHPTNVESLKFVNEKMGYLNPVELDREVLQACDAEKIIFSETDITDAENIEEYVNFDTKYYYIATKETAKEMSSLLEGFKLIENFEMLSEEAAQRFIENYDESLDTSDRGIFSNLWNGIKKIAKAVATAAKTVINFIAKPYTISGTIKYTYGNQQFPAYGVKVKNVTLGGLASNTDANGSFNLGARTDSAGLCFLWLDYENDACKLTNFLGVTASTLVKTALPSYLQNVTITSGSDYANAKMAICSDMLSRYNDEAKRHGKIPQAYVWTTEFGDGTSSAPSFRVMGSSLLPDIILTGVSSKSGSQYLGTIQTLHHEYTHFLHCAYTANKNRFWDNIVLSEIGCTIANATVDVINKIFGSDFKTGYIDFYNFENPYVCFAENYAEWYSYVGCYGKGPVGRSSDSYYGDGTHISKDTTFSNQEIFINLVKLLNRHKKVNSADIIVSLVDKYDITTFNELYTALIKEYPELKSQINETFKQHYKQYGSKPGNVVKPQ